jgi:hypothetical protein
LVLSVVGVEKYNSAIFLKIKKSAAIFLTPTTARKIVLKFGSVKKTLIFVLWSPATTQTGRSEKPNE